MGLSTSGTISKGGIIHGVLAWRAKGDYLFREDYTRESMVDYYKVHRRCQNHMHFKETLSLLMLACLATVSSHFQYHQIETCVLLSTRLYWQQTLLKVQ